MSSEQTKPTTSSPNGREASGDSQASRAMPADFAISLRAKAGGDQQLLNPGGGRRQPMRGFEDTYVDIVDYIVRITHRIWEEKEIGYIYNTYRHNARVTDDFGLQYGREKIVADTVHTINAFPDIRIFADEIIWAGDDSAGFHTSHRGVMIGHNTGWSKYGSPTGRRIVVWAIANCSSLENEIYEEWVLYNTSALLQQLGFDLRRKARELANERDELSPPLDVRTGEPERLPGQGKPPHLAPPATDPFDIEAFLRWGFHYTWNWRNVGHVDRTHASTLRFHGPTNRVYYGRGEYKSFILSLLAMFPDLALQIDDLYWMGNQHDAYLSSTRWSAVGTHCGWGSYGKPTGRRVHIWGITQHSIRNGQIVEEWMLFNEFELMQQIYRDEPFERQT